MSKSEYSHYVTDTTVYFKYKQQAGMYARCHHSLIDPVLHF